MKTVSLIAGIVLLALGAACFIPGVAVDGVVFGMFPVSTPLAIAFIVTGLIGIGIGVTRRHRFIATRSDGSDMRDSF